MRSLTWLAISAACLVALALSPVSARLAPRRHVGALNRRLGSSMLHASENDAQPQWLTQKLDHQDLVDNKTFLQKYYVNDTYWNPAAPVIFLMIGGEGPVSPAYVQDHFVTGPLSAKYGALNVALEHRFYGDSVPNQDSSTANLKYLSSSQALEDLVTLHQLFTQQYGAAKWIVFGGSYSGNLAAWARLKYPHLFLGSFAASAPVQAQLDFPEYFEVVSRSVGPSCSAKLASAQATINGLLELQAGPSKLQAAFNICSPMLEELDIVNFLSDITNPIADTVQYNDDQGRTDFDIGTICALMEEAPDSFTGLVNVWNAYNKKNGQTGCTDVSYTNMIAEMQESSAGRSWVWQTCTEFGYYQTGSSSAQPFSANISLAFYVDMCQDVYGITGLTPNIDRINAYYGGNAIVATNTAFTQGTVDPWSVLGTYQSFEPCSQSIGITITGTAHCADLYTQKPSDLPGLIDARLQKEQMLAQWLGAPKPAHAKRTKRNMLTEQ